MIRFTVAPGRLTDIGSCVLASCSRSGYGAGTATLEAELAVPGTRPVRRPPAPPARAAGARGRQGCKGSGAVPSSLETLGCGASAGGPRRNSLDSDADWDTWRHPACTWAVGRAGRGAAGTDRPRGGRRIGLFRPPPPARAGRVTHALSHPTDHTDPSLAHVVAM